MKKILILFTIFLVLLSCGKKEKMPTIPTTSFAFAGDVMLDRGVARILDKKNLYLFSDIEPLLKNPTISFINLETSVSLYGKKFAKPYCFKSHPKRLFHLTNAGIDVVSSANNHSMDTLTIGIINTLSNLKNYGILATGAGTNLAHATKPVIFETNGVRIGILAFGDIAPIRFYASKNRAGVAGLFSELIVAEIKKLRKRVDFVVVSVHWGIEYKDFITKNQRDLAHLIIDTGADLIVGHHPHVLQGIEQYKTGMIFYSLGNFIFDQKKEIKTRYSMVGRATLKPILTPTTNSENKISYATNIDISYMFAPILRNYDTFIPERPHIATQSNILQHLRKISKPYNKKSIRFTEYVEDGCTNYIVSFGKVLS